MDLVENVVFGLFNFEQIMFCFEEGVSCVLLQFFCGMNVDEVVNDFCVVFDDLCDELFFEVDVLCIWKFDFDCFEVVSFVVMMICFFEELMWLLEDDLVRCFEQIFGVGMIEVCGGVYCEICVEFFCDCFVVVGLIVFDVRDVLVCENLMMLGGNVKDGFEDFYVCVVGEYVMFDEIGCIVIWNIEGLLFCVCDVVIVFDDYEDVCWFVDVNGLFLVSFGIQKQSGVNIVVVVDEVCVEVVCINVECEDFYFFIFFDQSEFIW